MNLIPQRSRSDCAVAVLAMLAELPWEAANHLLRRDRNATGTPTAALVRVLKALGYHAEQSTGAPGFALIHVGIEHFVAIRPDGVILDPGGMPPWWWPDLGEELPRIGAAPYVREVWTVERVTLPSLPGVL